MLYKAAEHIKAVVKAKPDALLALSAGEDCLRLYEKLAEKQQAGEICFAKTRFFAVTELCGLAPEDARSVQNTLRVRFLDRVEANRQNCVFLSEGNWEEYDALIRENGGIDLAILALGNNARIGFNEPATPFDSLTHRQKLTDSSRQELAAVFSGTEDVPEYGLTMGIKTLVSARDILVISVGESRADAVFKTLYGRNDSVVPAAFLQIPLNVTVYLDEASAQKL